MWVVAHTQINGVCYTLRSLFRIKVHSRYELIYFLKLAGMSVVNNKLLLNLTEYVQLRPMPMFIKLFQDEKIRICRRYDPCKM